MSYQGRVHAVVTSLSSLVETVIGLTFFLSVDRKKYLRRVAAEEVVGGADVADATPCGTQHPPLKK